MPNPNETLVELAKLDESARSLLFTKGRTANSFSSRPVTDQGSVTSTLCADVTDVTGVM